MSDNKFPSEIIDLPSEGKLYSKEHPCSDGKIEIKYMTAKEEDILTSQNLIKKGVVIDRLLDSLILTQGVKTDDLVVGDKNAVMVAARVLAYGPEYPCEVTNPKTGETLSHTFNLADCPFKKLPKNVKENSFEITLPISKKKVKFSILTGKEENLIENDLKASRKVGAVAPELTTRLRYIIREVDGESSQSIINDISINMLARDSMFLREEMNKVSPDIELSQEIEIEGESVKVDIPMTVGFFWPNIGR
tara:strand:- start:5739 stop:6485 length:747 start_codon:yes stop_codon:yes gene_type:complete